MTYILIITKDLAMCVV